MSLPVVAIVGRPNVGKSSLLNALVGRRISIVDPTPGVTRDRVSAPLPVGAGYAELLDTAGFIDSPAHDRRDNIAEEVIRQIEFALSSAGVILFVVDAREGATPLDRAVAERLRKTDKPVLLVANKVDQAGATLELGSLAALGFGQPLAVSASHRLGLDDVLEALESRLGQAGTKPPEPEMKLAIVGKRNVGKSTFINALAGQERVIVSEIPGTTRDSIDVNIELDGMHLTAIDTAGVRKKSSMADDIEYYSHHRTLRSIRRADVVLLMMDALEPIGMVEKQLAGYIVGEFKPTVLVVNKWDLASQKADQDDYGPYLERVMPEIAYAPIVFTTAPAGVGVREAIVLAGELVKQARVRVPTAELNETIIQIIAQHAPKSGRLGAPRIYYATQISTAPPTIVCFVNDVASFDLPYQRFLLNQFRQRLPYPEVPMRLVFRQRRRSE